MFFAALQSIIITFSFLFNQHSHWVSTSFRHTKTTFGNIRAGFYRLHAPAIGPIWYTVVGPHNLLNCPILPSSVDSVATYCRKTPQITQLSNFEFAGGARSAQKVERRCTSTNLPLSNGTNFLSTPTPSW